MCSERSPGGLLVLRQGWGWEGRGSASFDRTEDDSKGSLNCDHLHIGDSCRCHGLARTVLVSED